MLELVLYMSKNLKLFMVCKEQIAHYVQLQASYFNPTGMHAKLTTHVQAVSV